MLFVEAMDDSMQYRVESTPPVAGTALPDGEILLVVDDDNAVRSFVCLASRRLGYQVLEASNGIEALKEVEENQGKICLVLTDINMPVMNGLELVRALQKRANAPAIAVMSGRLDPVMLSALQAEGITALLGKPFSSESLRLTLLKAVAAKR